MNAVPFPDEHGRHRFEIELDEVACTITADRQRGDIDPGLGGLGSRRLIAAAAVLAAALTLAVTAVAVVDGTDEQAAASLPDADPSQRITTPPTLPPLVTLPLAAPPDEPGDRSTRSTVRSAPLWRVPTAALVEFDLDTAVGDLADDVARRSRTRYAFDDRSVDAVIVHDPTTGRDDVVLTAASSRLRFVIDRNTSTVHLDRTSDALRSQAAWDAVGGDRFVRPPDGLTLGVWIDRLMLGPITPTSSEAATVSASDWLTSLDEGFGVARRFEVRFARNDVPEWLEFPFDGVGATTAEEQGSPPAIDDPIELEAFVGQGSDLIMITGTIGTGDGRRTFTHYLERLPNPSLVGLPGDALVIPFPAEPQPG